MKAIKISKKTLESLRWEQDPRDAGQTVDCRMAISELGIVVRSYDRSQGDV